MRVAVLHDDIPHGAAPDCADVLVQADTVSGALERLGHDVLHWPCTLNLAALRRQIEAKSPDVAFNLVESINGRGSLIHLPPFCLEAWGILYTGAPAAAILETSNKIMAKERMIAAGLPTPPWEGPVPGRRLADSSYFGQTGSPEEASTWIIKSVWEHASIGLDASGLVRQTRSGIRSLLPSRAKNLGGTCFAEIYIHGREFNLSLLAGPRGPEVLPPSEILFVGFPPEKPKIVDYRAKWDENSYAFHHTPRRFDFNGRDADLLQELKDLALTCWHVFGLAGYARVDFRVDEAGRPWILEINANPCLSTDAGFAAAAARAGLTTDDVVSRILESAMADNRSRFRFYERCAVRPVISAGYEMPAKEDGNRTNTTGRSALRFCAGLSAGSEKGIDSRQETRQRLHGIVYRHEPAETDPKRVRRLVEITGFFSAAEMDIAEDLAVQRLQKGDDSGYYFIFAEHFDRLAGYVCYGPIPATRDRYDLYWIAVHPDFQGRGLGRHLLRKVEDRIAKTGGGRLYADTSQRSQYAGTRAFYEDCGFQLEAVLKDFYAPGDGKVIYRKSLVGC